ncbi:MAG: hypothetical protein ACTHJ8_05810 [Mucilaginibacter sp.]
MIQALKKQAKLLDDAGFLVDGIICPDKYGKQQVKVLVVLSECYGYEHCNDVYIENQIKDDILGISKSSTQTAKKIPALLWPVFQSLKEKKKILYDDCPYFFLSNDANGRDLQETLSKIAWINVKKFSNDEVSQDDSKIYKSCFDNKELLQLQIDSIAPDLIIVCGNVVINGLRDAKLLGDDLLTTKNIVQTNKLGQKVIFVNHPSHYGSWGYKSIYALYETIYEEILEKLIN